MKNQQPTATIKARPILFSGDMVRALLAGTKTQTRREVRPQPEREHSFYFDKDATLKTGEKVGAWFGVDESTKTRGAYFPCPYGQPGDRLWVREGFYAYGYWCDIPGELNKLGKPKREFVDLTNGQHPYRYNDDAPGIEFKPSSVYGLGYHKRLGRFMPRAACRLLLQITAVRCERLQDISEADAVAEGIEVVDGLIDDSPGFRNYMLPGVENAFGYPINSYLSLWRSINGPESCKANPWVWVVEFKVISGATPQQESHE